MLLESCLNVKVIYFRPLQYILTVVGREFRFFENLQRGYHGSILFFFVFSDMDWTFFMFKDPLKTDSENFQFIPLPTYDVLCIFEVGLSLEEQSLEI